ncbi:hypothetical protein [Helicobacter labetoulli]|uniref:hypothetical protein n=1 Tax=Helicobacter labetoulli TaxID=2315333 RepID=UPI000EF6B64D|nr:hypothetical protein [Helicobacter labetoulli]
MKRIRAFHRFKNSFKGFSPFKVKRVLIPQNRKRTFSRLDFSPLKSIKSQVRKKAKEAYILQGLKNDASKHMAINRPFGDFNFNRSSICEARKKRRKAIMSLTKGQGLRVKKTEWKAESKIKCS